MMPTCTESSTSTYSLDLSDDNHMNEINECTSFFDFMPDLDIIEREYDSRNEDCFNLFGFNIADNNESVFPNDNNFPIETMKHKFPYLSNSLNDNTYSIASSDNSNESFSLVRYNPPKLLTASFQRPHEPRIKYLIRSISLWQEFMNSGDLDKLHVLFKDIFCEDHIILNDNKLPPIIGLRKLCDVKDSLLRNIPDYCVFYNNIMRLKRRVITMKAKSFGTLPYANVQNKKTFLWDIFENTSIDKLDEHHRIQKIKYDTLKSQFKFIQFEISVSWTIFLNRANQQIEKMSASRYKVDIL